MFHQLAVKVSEDCELANMVAVFALNDCVGPIDILHQTNSPPDSKPMISSTDFNTVWAIQFSQSKSKRFPAKRDTSSKLRRLLVKSRVL